MRQTIRNKTFETNSSSVHSLCILEKDSPVEMLNSLRFHVGFRSFAWEKEEYTTVLPILEYLWTMVHYGPIDNKYINLMKEWLPNCTFEESGIDSCDLYDCNGHDIDHGADWFEPIYEYSGGTEKVVMTAPVERLFSSKEIFADAVLNSRLATWNDNADGDLTEFLAVKGAKTIFYKGN